MGIYYNEDSDLLDHLATPGVFAYQEGYASVPKGPGLGIEVNEEKVRVAARAGHNWRNPVWRNKDGTVAGW